MPRAEQTRWDSTAPWIAGWHDRAPVLVMTFSSAAGGGPYPMKRSMVLVPTDSMLWALTVLGLLLAHATNNC